MKTKIAILILLVLFSFQSAFAQCNLYHRVKAEYIDNGWTLAVDRYCSLSEGQSSIAFSQYFASYNDYVVVAFSCDDDVTDLDLYLYTSGGDLYSKDNDNNSVAVVSFSPLSSRYLQITAKNYASNSYSASPIRIMVFSRYR